MKTILLTTDLTASSDRAMERALKLAKETRAKLHIIYVMPVYKTKKLGASFKKDAEGLVKGYLYDYKNSENINVVIKVLEGKTAFAEIVGYAE